jgi:predicted secreted hydrolase
MDKIDEKWVRPHLNFSTEWWYFTGFLNEKFGFEVSVFLSNERSFLFGTYFPFVKPFLAHFAITDTEKGQFVFNEWSKMIDISRYAESSLPLYLQIGGASLMANGNGYLIQTNTEYYTLSLLVEARKPPVFHGTNGIIKMGKGSSYYYSFTNMNVTGILRREKEFIAVKGSAWHDHQFGDFTVKNIHWKWFSLRLDNNMELMAFMFEDKKGDVQKYLTAVLPDGSKKFYKDFSVKELKTENKMGTEWNLEFSEGSFIISSMLGGQTVRSKIFSVPEYAEMLSIVKGNIFGQDVSGYAYVEVV